MQLKSWPPLIYIIYIYILSYKREEKEFFLNFKSSKEKEDLTYKPK